MRKSWDSLLLYSSCRLCRHVCSCLFEKGELPSNRVATRPWLAFQAKAMVKRNFFLPEGGKTLGQRPNPSVGARRWHRIAGHSLVGVLINQWQQCFCLFYNKNVTILILSLSVWAIKNYSLKAWSSFKIFEMLSCPKSSCNIRDLKWWILSNG